jgi:hypothetical protein
MQNVEHSPAVLDDNDADDSDDESADHRGPCIDAAMAAVFGAIGLAQTAHTTTCLCGNLLNVVGRLALAAALGW